MTAVPHGITNSTNLDLLQRIVIWMKPMATISPSPIGEGLEASMAMAMFSLKTILLSCQDISVQSFTQLWLWMLMTQDRVLQVLLYFLDSLISFPLDLGARVLSGHVHDKARVRLCLVRVQDEVLVCGLFTVQFVKQNRFYSSKEIVIALQKGGQKLWVIVSDCIYCVIVFINHSIWPFIIMKHFSWPLLWFYESTWAKIVVNIFQRAITRETNIMFTYCPGY